MSHESAYFSFNFTGPAADYSIIGDRQTKRPVLPVLREGPDSPKRIAARRRYKATQRLSRAQHAAREAQESSQ